MDKYLSIITNFGCHYKCPYCVVKNNNINVPATTLEGLDNLEAAIQFGDFNIVSVSGGGDPLHDYDKHKDWYDKLFAILKRNNIPLEMHTSYLESDFPYSECKRVVYHVTSKDLNGIWNIKQFKDEIIRLVLVATENLKSNEIIGIAIATDMLKDISELIFRQMINDKYQPEYYNHELLKWGIGKVYGTI